MPSGRETLAIAATFAAIGAGFGAGSQFDQQANARARAITAETCGSTYNSGDKITQQTQDCLSQAWIPQGETVTNTYLKVGSPGSLLRGYAKIEEAKGRNFDAHGTLVAATIGGLLGLFLGGLATSGTRRR